MRTVIISYPQLNLKWWRTRIRTNLIKIPHVSEYKTMHSCLGRKKGMKKKKKTYFLSSPVYPSSGVSVNVDQNQTFHWIWVCKLKRESWNIWWHEKTPPDWMFSDSGYLRSQSHGQKWTWVPLWRKFQRASTEDGTHWELGEDVRSRSHTHSDYSTEAGRRTE